MRYPYAPRPAVGPVELALAPGEKLLLLGASGGGKSTLLLALTGLIPSAIPAEVTGAVEIGGEPAAARSPAQWADRVGMLFQDAEQTLCGMLVDDEIGFALENRGLPAPAIEARVDPALAALGLPPAMKARRITTLSGGEKQLVALAALVAAAPAILLADEPTAQLAPRAVAAVRDLILGDPALTVLVVDHQLDGLVERIDRVVVLGGDGRIAAEGAPRELFRRHHGLLAGAGIWRPAAADLDAMARADGLHLPVPPLSMAEAVAQLDPRDPAARALVGRFLAGRRPGARAAPGADVARLADASLGHDRRGPVLREVTLGLRAGEITGLAGANGSGKSTLGAALAGVLKPLSGRREGPPGVIAFQNPEHQFVAAKVSLELAASLPQGAGETEARIAEAVERWSLAGLDELHPFQLSQGQKRRLQLACLELAAQSPLMVLDEPGTGLDAAAQGLLVAHLERLRAEGRALLLISHDMDLLARLCDRLLLLGEGRVLAEGAPGAVFADAGLLARAGLAAPSDQPAADWLAGAEAP